MADLRSEKLRWQRSQAITTLYDWSYQLQWPKEGPTINLFTSC